jgi:hypothetical protein
MMIAVEKTLVRASALKRLLPNSRAKLVTGALELRLVPVLKTLSRLAISELKPSFKLLKRHNAVCVFKSVVYMSSSQCFPTERYG